MRDKKDAPSVSVLMPTYNNAKYLAEAIESVLAQSYIDYELIIVDDASADNTSEIGQSYVKKDSRVRFVQNKVNLGQAGNLNKILGLAQGKYIKCMFADDKFNSISALGKQVKILENDPRIALVTSSRKIIDENSQELCEWHRLGRHDRRFCGKRLIRKCVRKGNLIGEPSAVLFRRSAAGRGFDSAYSQLIDLEMWLHLLQAGDLYYFADLLCCFRIHPDQITAKNKARGVCFNTKESISLCYKYLSGWMLSETLFYHFHRIRKKKRPELDAIEKALRSHYNLVEYFLHTVWYRVNKPLIKLYDRLCVKNA